ncbi:uncharacterized protein LOC110275096 isoform X4 [Arachis duranensis]|uniref:Uncharacterized protein LOC110275096 isoform X4 n=1 Tax=Arachis duranensis TaxID=130453 RepID=A0A9C6TKW4_ARADU|nr:uncharacterized protein LOC110275096 isoform X4 [Arachis duranensis]
MVTYLLEYIYYPDQTSRTCTLHWIGVRKRVGQCLCPLRVKFNRSKSLNILPKIRQKIRMYPVLLQVTLHKVPIVSVNHPIVLL